MLIKGVSLLIYWDFCIHFLSLFSLRGLLGAHFAAVALKEKGHRELDWYNGELLRMSEELGRRLLPAFNTSTGLPYPKVSW